MNIEEFTVYCLFKKGVTESFPFGGDTLVFKVMNKMFALCSLDGIPLKANLKCDPEWGVQLRERHDDIFPGFHMNKTHWNTVNLEGTLEDALVKNLIDHSYDLVVKSLSQKDQLFMSSL
jgi:predicted DNA-binding protein (MmcQ/YjbR family)